MKDIPEKGDVLYYANYSRFPDIYMLAKIKINDVLLRGTMFVCPYEVLEWFYSESVASGRAEYFYDGQSEFYTLDSMVDYFSPDHKCHYFTTPENLLKWLLK